MHVEFNIMKPIIVAIEGNIGAGKTTFATKLCDRLNDRGIAAVLVNEPVNYWTAATTVSGDNKLEQFYKNTTDNCFWFESYALLTRFVEFQQAQSKKTDFILIDRWPRRCIEIFAQKSVDEGILSQEELTELRRLACGLFPHDLDVTIHLETDPITCAARQAARDGYPLPCELFDRLDRMYLENIKDSRELLIKCINPSEDDVADELMLIL